MTEYERVTELSVAEQQVRECLAELTPERRKLLEERRGGTEISTFLENVETLLNSVAAERELTTA